MNDDEFPRFDLEGQVALVTGAARGIGRACALALAHAGADVALGLRDVQSAGDLAREIEAMGRRALRLPMDMTRLDQIGSRGRGGRAPLREARHPGEQRRAGAEQSGPGRVARRTSTSRSP